MKPYTFLLLALILIISGCTEKTTTTEQVNITTTSVNIPTIDHDQLFKETFTKYAPLINLDAANLVSDSISSSRTSAMMQTDSQTIITDTEKALEEMRDLNISSKYADSYNEYLYALDSYNAAGKAMLNVTNGANVDTYTIYMTKANEGTEHMEKAVVLFNAVSGSSITLKNVIKFT